MGRAKSDAKWSGGATKSCLGCLWAGAPAGESTAKMSIMFREGFLVL